MPDIEDDLKLQNWLSVLTFDAFKYVKAGGELVIEWTDEGLVLRLLGVQVDTEGVNSKFKRYALQTAPNVVLEAQT
jgi:hypothetical protein